MKLSEIPIDDLRVGDKCISYLGTPGSISLVHKDVNREKDDEADRIEINWDNGKKSHQPHIFMDKVEYIGR